MSDKNETGGKPNDVGSNSQDANVDVGADVQGSVVIGDHNIIVQQPSISNQNPAINDKIEPAKKDEKQTSPKEAKRRNRDTLGLIGLIVTVVGVLIAIFAWLFPDFRLPAPGSSTMSRAPTTFQVGIVVPTTTATLITSMPPTVTSSPTITPSLTPTDTATPVITNTPTAIPINAIPFETLLNQCRGNTFLNQGAILNVLPGCADPGREGAIQLVWSASTSSSNAGCTIALDSISTYAMRNKALVFWARSINPDEQVVIKLRDATHEEEKLVHLSTSWQQVALNFLSDFPSINLGQIKTLTIGIDYDPARAVRNGKGSACFSNFGFGAP